MLLSLSVQNYALIEQLNINFTNQFATITGETGAGKSILLGALGLIMGNRADLSSLKDKEKKCVIEASFEVSKYNLKPLFEANDLDYENTTIIRREILPSGKSRAFINDTPVNLSELQILAENLIDIHSQHQTRELEQQNYQISILDAIGANSEYLREYSILISDFKHKSKELEQAIADKNTLFSAQEYNSYLLNELEQIGLQPNEQADLEEELLSLNNSELISETLSKLVSSANDEQFGFITALKDCKNALHKIANFSTSYSELYERLNSSLIELEDIAEKFKLIPEEYRHYDVFVPCDETAVALWQQYLETVKIENPFEKKRKVKALKPQLLQYVTRFPKNKYDPPKTQFDKWVIYESNWDVYYDLKTGFKADSSHDFI